jgi:putative tricarboxylic transport membrane protein
MKDVASSIFLLCFGLFYLILSFEYHAGRVGNPQAGFLPRIVGVLTLFVSLLLLISSLRRYKEKEGAISIRKGLDKNCILRGLMALGAIMAYLFILNYFGFLLCTAVLVWFLAWVMGGTRWWLNVLLGVVTSGLLFWIFWIMMRVPLPLGSIWGR